MRTTPTHRWWSAPSRRQSAIQATLKALGIGGDAPEQEASRAADAVARRAPAHVSLLVGSAIQRAPKDPAINGAQTDAAPDTASPTDLTADAPSLLVDDDSQPGAGQMRKSDFLAEIHNAVCSTADEGIGAIGRDFPRLSMDRILVELLRR